MVTWGWVCLPGVGGGFDSAVRWRSRAGSTGLEKWKLVEPGCDEGAARVETMVTWGWVCPPGASGGFDSAVYWRSRAGSTGLEKWKLVEPGCDEGAARVETMVRVSGVLGQI